MSDFFLRHKLRPCTAYLEFWGVLMALGWLAFLSPPFGAKYLYPYILVAAIGEGLLTLRLLVMGVTPKRGRSRLPRRENRNPNAARRGFMTLAEQHLKVSRRMQRDFFLVYADMDGLKQINDTFGHEEGSNAIKQGVTC